MIKYMMCAIGGVALGYAIAHSKLEGEFQNRLNKEIEDAKDLYRRKYEKKLQEQTASPEFLKAAAEAADALELYRGVGPEPLVIGEGQLDLDGREVEGHMDEFIDEEDEPEPEKTPSIVVPEPPSSQVVNYNKVSTKEPEKSTAEKEAEYTPSFITSEEFIQNETDYKQYSITYFHGDDILAGESDQVVELEVREVTLGREVMDILKAGPEAMGGADTLYIRNDNEAVELEIAWSPGKYSVEVLNQAG